MPSNAWVDLITLISVLNPIAVVPLYLSITRRLDGARRNRVLVRAIVISAVILLLFMAAGEVTLNSLGVGLDAFRVAGGLVLLLTSLRMIFGDESAGRAVDDEAERDVAVFPLAMPVIAGPGAMMAVVLLTQNDRHEISEQIETALVLLGVLALNFVVLRMASTVERVLGSTGMNVMARVTGMILAALATQTILTGLKNGLLR